MHHTPYTIHQTITTRFWNVLRGFSQEEKALFLQFVTGTSKVSSIPIHLHKLIPITITITITMFMCRFPWMGSSLFRAAMA
ncbi:hypothetical protein EON65_05505 [archaeon]|nr:MAG: hypothetical protein EON65_05505 [archaeon]